MGYAAQRDFASHAQPDTLGSREQAALQPVVRPQERHARQTQTVQTTIAGQDAVQLFSTTPTVAYAEARGFVTHVKPDTVGNRE